MSKVDRYKTALDKQLKPNRRKENYNLYVNLHGGNQVFTSINDVREQSLCLVPDNLFVIYFYNPGQSGILDEGLDDGVRHSLKTLNWVLDINNGKKSRRVDTPLNNPLNNTLKESAHLYFPGDPIYNKVLAFDWKHDFFRDEMDIYELREDRPEYEIHKLQEIENPHKNYTIKESRPRKKVAYPGGKYISTILNDALLRDQTHMTLDDLLQRISENTSDNGFRIVYIYNCDPMGAIISRRPC